MSEECVGRGHMDHARHLSLTNGTKFEQEIDVVQRMIDDRCLIPCPVHTGRYVISLRWAQANGHMPSLPDEEVLETECFRRQVSL